MCHVHQSRLFLLLALLVLQTWAASASASCANPYCLCFSGPNEVIVQATVLDRKGNTAIVQIDAVDNPTVAPTSLAVGATSTVDLSYYIDAAAAFPIGQRFLGKADIHSPGLVVIVPISKEVRVNCGTLSATVSQAIAIIRSGDCPAAMRASGFKEPACNDTGVVEQGCAARRQGGDWPGLLLAALLPLAWFWRRRPAR